MDNAKSHFRIVVFTIVFLTGCGGGGGSTASPAAPPANGGPPNGTATASPSPNPPSYTVSGKIVSIPHGAFGPSAPQAPLANAIVIVGPTLVLGPTPPPTIPPGDAQATTDANGNYTATLAAAPVSPTSVQAIFVKPTVDLSGVSLPTSGYYLSVFGPGVDGKSANMPLPAHAFSAVVSGMLATQRVSVATIDEASFLALINRDRIANAPAASTLYFDENAEEAARLHASDEASNNYYCHYDRNAVGPESRYLRLFGLGANAENLGQNAGATVNAYTTVEGQFMAEKMTNGGHYANIVDPAHMWGGVSTAAATDGAQYIDQELISPTQVGAYEGYPIGPGARCPAGVTVNNS